MDDAPNLPRHGRPNAAHQRPEQEMNDSQGEVADAHKRSSKRRGILGRVPFGEISEKDDNGPSTLTRHDADNNVGGRGGTPRGSGIAAGRKRKGSLRQGLLGKNMLRRGPHENQRMSTQPPSTDTSMPETAEEETTPRPFGYEHATRNSSSESGWTPTAGPSHSPSITRSSSYELDRPGLAAPIPTSTAPYASTTDDEEAISVYHPSTSSSFSYKASSFQAAGATAPLPRRRSHRAAQHTSLSTVQSPTDLALEEEWDYSETEWWGWIILIATWAVFVVGMGSCLGVWSWAWDVGETPYAPPELEDDPTLPITGYYPALIVCTAVMAWVWVVVAWVGMKYFRHSKMVSDDG